MYKVITYFISANIGLTIFLIATLLVAPILIIAIIIDLRKIKKQKSNTDKTNDLTIPTESKTITKPHDSQFAESYKTSVVQNNTQKNSTVNERPDSEIIKRYQSSAIQNSASQTPPVINDMSADERKPHKEKKNRSVLFVILSYISFALIWISIAIYSAGAGVDYFSFFVPGGESSGNHGSWEAFSFIAFISIIAFFIFGFIAFTNNFPEKKIIKYLTAFQFGIVLAVVFISSMIERLIEFLANNFLKRDYKRKLDCGAFLSGNKRLKEISKNRDYELQNYYDALMKYARTCDHDIKEQRFIESLFSPIGYHGGEAYYTRYRDDKSGTLWLTFDGKKYLQESNYENYKKKIYEYARSLGLIK